MPDDLTAHQLELLRKLTGKLDRLLDRSAQDAEAAQLARSQLDALGKKVTSYIDEDRAVRKAQLALVDAHAEYVRQFGHYQAVRRCATGMLRAMTTETVRPAALLGAAEQLMVDACDYWLSPAQVALAAWVSDMPANAERAVREAMRRDPARSALWFSLVLARFGRPAEAGRWITEYARAQDPSALTGEFPAVLDAVARGALGGPARECLLDACRGWRDQAGESAGPAEESAGPAEESGGPARESGGPRAQQVASWTEFVRRQRQSLTDTFPALRPVSRDWPATLGKLEAATAFGRTEQWCKDTLARAAEGDEGFRAAADDLLRDLISAPDQAESALLDMASRSRAIIENAGRPPTSSSGEPDEPVRTDLLTLATAIATGAYRGKPSEQAVRFCLVLSTGSVERAVTDLRQHVASTRPASIEITIDGWHHAVEPGDDPDTLVRDFAGWAHQAMTEDKAQAARRRLGVGRLPARIEHIESSWQTRSRAGQETVYAATAQVNRFFQRWQHEMTAAGRCVELLRDQPTGVGDTQEPRPVPEPAGLTLKLPGWDLRPPESASSALGGLPSRHAGTATAALRTAPAAAGRALVRGRGNQPVAGRAALAAAHPRHRGPAARRVPRSHRDRPVQLAGLGGRHGDRLYRLRHLRSLDHLGRRLGWPRRHQRHRSPGGQPQLCRGPRAAPPRPRHGDDQRRAGHA